MVERDLVNEHIHGIQTQQLTLRLLMDATSLLRNYWGRENGYRNSYRDVNFRSDGRDDLIVSTEDYLERARLLGMHHADLPPDRESFLNPERHPNSFLKNPWRDVEI